ncbi:MAG: hypothetical protein ABI927_06585 [Gaiellaceae bacterium]
MRRQLPLLLLLAVLAVLAGCGTVVTSSIPPAHAASPQRTELGWLESIGDRTGRIVFGVQAFEVTRDGWRAHISLENTTDVPFAVGLPNLRSSLEFGLMLFATGKHSELEARNASSSLPTIRPAETYTPALPAQLNAHESWKGTIAAGGPVAAGTWVRIVFGDLFPASVIVPKGTRPTKPVPTLPEALSTANIGSRLIWITDHAYELKR